MVTLQHVVNTAEANMENHLASKTVRIIYFTNTLHYGISDGIDLVANF